MKKAFLMLLAAIMIIGMFTACGGNNGNGEENDAPDETPIAEPDPEEITLPEAGFIYCDTFEGLRLYEVREDGEVVPLTAGFRETPMDLNDRLVRISTANMHNFTYDEEDRDRTPNETLEIRELLRGIERNYNMEFYWIQAELASAALSDIRAARLAGEPAHEILNINIFHTGPENIFNERFVMDLFSPAVSDIIDFYNQPWDMGSMVSRMWGRQHGVHFLTQNSGEMLSAIMIYNRDHAIQFQLGNFYEIFRGGMWNFSTFANTLRWVNINSGGTVLPFAYFREEFIGPGFILANGGEMVRRNDDGSFDYVGVTDDRTLEAMQFLQNLYREGLLERIDGLELGMGGSVFDSMLNRMAAGGITFITGEFQMLRRLTRHQPPHDHHFSLLPVPKGDHMDDHVAAMIRFDMWYIVNDIPRPDEIAAILVAMANRLSHTDIVRHERRVGVMDDESARILEFLLERRVIDYSRILGTRAPIQGRVNTVIQGNITPAAALQVIEPDVLGRIMQATVAPEDRE